MLNLKNKFIKGIKKIIFKKRLIGEAFMKNAYKKLSQKHISFKIKEVKVETKREKSKTKNINKNKELLKVSDI